MATTTNRPLSPHLQIYRPQVTSVLSITHRATGAFLAAGALVLAYWLAALAAGPESFSQANGILMSPIGKIALFAWLFCFYYHLGNGIRHLFWDAGRGYDLAVLTRSGYAVVTFAVIATVVSIVIA